MTVHHGFQIRFAEIAIQHVIQLFTAQRQAQAVAKSDLQVNEMANLLRVRSQQRAGNA